jgi:hypothetical protein
MGNADGAAMVKEMLPRRGDEWGKQTFVIPVGAKKLRRSCSREPLD